MEATAKEKFRIRQLRGTLKWAYGIPMYKRLWGEAPSDVKDIGALNALPVIDKALLVEAGEEGLHPELQPSVMIHTTGTTGKPFGRYRSREELTIIRQYADRVRAAFGDVRSETVTISMLDSTVHGGRVLPPEGRTIEASVTTSKGLASTLDLLSRNPLFPDQTRTEIKVVGRPTHVLVLLIATRDEAPAVLQRITGLVTTGDHLTRRYRSAVERCAPAAGVTNRYGLSEVFGGATECMECGYLHFDPHVIPELLPGKPVDGAPCYGELVLTELYPFSQIQPLIRYRTRDLFARYPVACTRDYGYEYLGRLAATRTNDLSDGNVSYAPTRLRDLLERRHDVGHRTLEAAGHGRYFGLTLGEPLADVQHLREGRQLKLRLAVAFSPALYPDEARKVRDWVQVEWPSVDPFLRAALAEGTTLEVELFDVADSSGPPPLRLRQQIGVAEV